MELMEEVKGYSDSREEEEEEEAAEIITITREESNSKHHNPFSSPSTTNYTASTPHHQSPWLGMHHHESPDGTPTTESHNSPCGLGLHQQDAAAPNFINHRKQQLDFTDLSLGANKDDEPKFQQRGSSGVLAGGGCSSSATHHGAGSSSTGGNEPVEKEHMFDKAVTPSDVGKLNRLVIPKQHAERYFPLDSSSNEKGLLLNFEDRNGKLWRFRYSYWNSSQSYVMTKGWSRFVKEKKLDAGDIVSFQRGLGELCRHRLYIDWRRRPDHPPGPSASLITPLLLPSHYSIRWGSGRLYSLPSPQASAVPRHHDHFQHLNYDHVHAFHHQQQQQQQQYHHAGGSHHLNSYGELNSGSGSVYYLRSTPSMSMVDQSLPGQQQERGTIAPMIIDSVPVAHHHNHRGGNSSGVLASGRSNSSTAGKRLRLFGVNMECASSPAEDQSKCLSSPSRSAAHVAMANSLPSPSPSPSSSLPPLQRLRVPHEDPRSSSSARFGDQRGETSVIFDLDPSLQYRQ